MLFEVATGMILVLWQFQMSLQRFTWTTLHLSLFFPPRTHVLKQNSDLVQMTSSSIYGCASLACYKFTEASCEIEKPKLLTEEPPDDLYGFVPISYIIQCTLWYQNHEVKWNSLKNVFINNFDISGKKNIFLWHFGFSVLEFPSDCSKLSKGLSWRIHNNIRYRYYSLYRTKGPEIICPLAATLS